MHRRVWQRLTRRETSRCVRPPNTKRSKAYVPPRISCSWHLKEGLVSGSFILLLRLCAKLFTQVPGRRELPRPLLEAGARHLRDAERAITLAGGGAPGHPPCSLRYVKEGDEKRRVCTLPRAAVAVTMSRRGGFLTREMPTLYRSLFLCFWGWCFFRKNRQRLSWLVVAEQRT